jgi:hypothetical protein
MTSSDFRDLVKECEDEAIANFGADNIGTKELRMQLDPFDQTYLVQWLVQRYNQKIAEIYNK